MVTPHGAVSQEQGDPDQLRMLGQCKGCLFEEIDLSERRMTGIDVRETTFRNVDFTNAGLGISIFDNAVLENVSFNGADLSGASFSDAQLTNVTFEGADLRAAVFEGVRLVGTDLQAGILCNTQMPDDMMDNSDCN
ncbi:hypothetical protein BOO69_08380 [Sulfitobacter alexandrii]|uniref:Pentapeptide repeat-containing protein n=2 Tax=Sulfitobacter alexandrii TaxID=1917485 RepID=A0A1J0WM89_9RHOB|nr:hypothetical protein BOO69_08380 [Sulfitobacter alexandrii]